MSTHRMPSVRFVSPALTGATQPGTHLVKQQPDGTDGPPLLNLGLRTTRLELEIRNGGYGNGVADAMKMLAEARHDTNKGKYETVVAFIQLEKHGAWWTEHGYRSLEDFRLRNGLPSGAALADWTVIIRKVTRETALLVGMDLLGEMIRECARFQPDHAERDADYAAIFANYCKRHFVFDAVEFRRHVYDYLNKKYKTSAPDTTKRPKVEGLKPGETLERVPATVTVVRPAKNADAAIGAESVAPRVETVRDFDVRIRRCPSCEAERSKAAAWQKWAEACEAVIIEKLGKGYLPTIHNKRPS